MAVDCKCFFLNFVTKLTRIKYSREGKDVVAVALFVSVFIFGIN